MYSLIIVSFCSYLNRTDLKTNNIKFNIDVPYKIMYKFNNIYFLCIGKNICVA